MTKKAVAIIVFITLCLLACGEVAPALTNRRAILKDDLSIPTPASTDTPSPTQTPQTCVVVAGENGTVYMRSGPGMDYTPIGHVVTNQDLYLVKDDHSGWILVAGAHGPAGWVYGEYLKCAH